jgi:hypothetical protein
MSETLTRLHQPPGWVVQIFQEIDTLWFGARFDHLTPFPEPRRGLSGSCLVAPAVILVADCFASLIWRVDLPRGGQATARPVTGGHSVVSPHHARLRERLDPWPHSSFTPMAGCRNGLPRKKATSLRKA